MTINIVPSEVNYNFSDPARVAVLKSTIAELLDLLPPAQRNYETITLRESLIIQQTVAPDSDEAHLSVWLTRLQILVAEIK